LEVIEDHIAMATEAQDITEQYKQTPEASDDSVPSLPVAIKDSRATKDLLFTLRHFHLGEPSAKDELEPVGDDCLPALLEAFRDTSKLRYDYPLFLNPLDNADGNQKASQLAKPISQYLRDSVCAFAPERETARILKDNLGWIERHLRACLKQQEAPTDAAHVLAQAGEALQDHLKLEGNDRDRLEDDLKRLLESVPSGSQILGYGRYAAIHLLIRAIRSRVAPRRLLFQKEIEKHIQGLKNLLDVEWGKSDESIEPRMARDSVGDAGSLFDPVALSTVMDHSQGSKAMSTERRERIEGALSVLEEYLRQGEPVLVRFVHLGKLADPWLDETPAFEAVSDPNPCAKATAIFDQAAARLARVFSAARIAKLEIDGIYDPTLHDPWFNNFNWEAFSHNELLLVPAVIALESADRVAGEGMRSFSRLLSSGRPAQILIRVQPHNNPGALPGEDPFQSYRIELGYLGISHRQAVVAQSSTARWEHLLKRFLSALDATRTGLHIISTGLRQPSESVALNAWLIAGAALEGRAHPFFHIDPAAGDSAEARVDFSDNPQPEVDWPIHPFQYRDDNDNLVTTEIAFTFADYALLIGRLRDHFRLVPPECDSNALVPVAHHLSMEADEAYSYIPFIWAVDGNSTLHRLVISRELIVACLDRRNYWRSLQELSGVRNQYVETAVRKTRQEAQIELEAERRRLHDEHTKELERVRTEAAGEAMQRLTNVLLDMDFSAPLDRPTTASYTAQPSPSETDEVDAIPETEPEIAQEEEEELSFEDPWIDTMLCTSCNDCLNINPILFFYNENKQAEFGDLNAGTYAQLVEAAEICPAHCIHPGRPSNPNEAGLEELILRAAPFN
jgi:ferredoxin